MLFRSTIVALLAACATARSVIPDFNIATDSSTGKRLLSNARRVEQNGQQNEQEADWLSGYSIKYDSCSSLIQVREEGNANDEEGILYTQNLVKFTVCPGNKSGACDGCGSGVAQYVVNMAEFIEAYVEMKNEQKEQACQTVAEYCYCENANDDQVCENQCFADAGMDECIEVEGQEQQDVAALMECAAMEGADGNNGGNNNYYGNNNNNGVDMYRQYYVGAMCSPKDGKSIYLAAFKDAGCVSYAGSGIYEAFNYGYSLPYEKESIVKVNDCISCLQVDENQNQNNNNNNNNNNGQNYNYNNNYQNQDAEVAEICQQSYEQAAKCENKLDLGSYFYADTSGCEYINKILPNLQAATRKIASGSSAVGGSTATAFAVIFGLTTALLGAYAFFLYRKIHRAKVNLAQAEMNMA